MPKKRKIIPSIGKKEFEALIRAFQESDWGDPHGKDRVPFAAAMVIRELRRNACSGHWSPLREFLERILALLLGFGSSASHEDQNRPPVSFGGISLHELVWACYHALDEGDPALAFLIGIFGGMSAGTDRLPELKALADLATRQLGALSKHRERNRDAAARRHQEMRAATREHWKLWRGKKGSGITWARKRVAERNGWAYKTVLRATRGLKLDSDFTA